MAGSPRQQQVAALLRDGWRPAQIAAHLGISNTAVRVHAHRARRAGLLASALRGGRPRQYDYAELARMRHTGMTFEAIRAATGAAPTVVYAAMTQAGA